MNIHCLLAWLAEEEKRSLLQRMDPGLRAKVLAALTGLVILGLAMCCLAWMGARMTRRYMNQGPRQKPPPGPVPDDWAGKALVPRVGSEPDTGAADE